MKKNLQPLTPAIPRRAAGTAASGRQLALILSPVAPFAVTQRSPEGARDAAEVVLGVRVRRIGYGGGPRRTDLRALRSEILM